LFAKQKLLLLLQQLKTISFLVKATKASTAVYVLPQVPTTSLGPLRDVTLPQKISKPKVLNFFNKSTRKSASYDTSLTL